MWPTTLNFFSPKVNRRVIRIGAMLNLAITSDMYHDQGGIVNMFVVDKSERIEIMSLEVSSVYISRLSGTTSRSSREEK